MVPAAVAAFTVASGVQEPVGQDPTMAAWQGVVAVEVLR